MIKGLLGKAVIFVVLFIFLGFFEGKAQKKEVVRDNQQWLHLSAQVRLSEKWSLLFDSGYRWRNFFENKAHYLLRSGVGYRLSPKIGLSTGIITMGFYSMDRLNRIEIRPFQDVNYTHFYGILRAQHRLRVEERYFRNIENGALGNKDSFNFRFSYSLIFTMPLVRFRPSNPDALLFFRAGDEIFLNAGKEIVHNRLDQNRIVIGPALQWNKNLAFSLSYFYQYGTTIIPGRYRLSDIVVLGTSYIFRKQTKQVQGKE